MRTFLFYLLAIVFHFVASAQPETNASFFAHGQPESKIFEKQLVILTADIADAATLIKDLGEHQEVYQLSPERSAVEQLTDLLRAHQGLHAVHLLSHGSPATIQLGSEKLDGANLPQYTETIRQWGRSLAPGGSFLLYGCEVAKGEAGAVFISQIADLLQAPVAASVDLTGAARQGGNWVLEHQTGTLAANALNIAVYNGVLQTAPPAGVYSFANGLTSNGTVTTADGYFLATGISGGVAGTPSTLASDADGAFNNSFLASGTSYMEVRLKNGGSFALSSVGVGDYFQTGTTAPPTINHDFYNVYVAGYTGGVEVARTPQHSSVGIYEATYPLNFSAFAGKTIDFFRVYYSFNSGVQESYLNLINVTVVATPSISIGTISPTSFCAGGNVSVPFTTTGSFTAGNTFTAQLSNAAGSFAAPVNIGIFGGATSGTIIGIIPSTATGGTGYRIRVISSNPAITSTDNGSNLKINAITTSGAQTNVSCFGGSNGAATVSPTGGTTPYSYSWSPSGGTGATATGLAAGLYTVTITDAIGCTATRSFTITQPATPISGSTVVTNVACFGSATGAINLTPSGGTPGYTYLWNNGATTQDLTGLAAGTYSVAITDANGCQTTLSNIIVSQPSTAITGSTVVTNVSCFSGSNGAINLTPSGGTGPYTFVWNNGATSEDRTGLPAGAYSVTITDANGCQGTVSNIIVTQPPTLSGSTVVTNVACFGGSTGAINLTPSGGTPGYTYLWNNGAATQDRTGLTAGTYSVTITDANNCQATISNITVSQPSAAITGSTVVTNVACFGGSNGAINLTPAGGTAPYTFLWNNGATTEDRTGLAAGTYSVTITDANGCTGIRNVTITQPSAFSVTTSQTNVSCHGGSNGTATVIVNGATPGYTYSWSPSGGTGATASGLTAGTYTVTVTDANSCQITRSFTITEPAATAITTQPVGQTLCVGGAATFTVAATAPSALSYQWKRNGSAIAGVTSATYSIPSVTAAHAGTYSVDVTTACGTVSSNNAVLTVNPLPAASVSGTTTVCQNAAAPSITFSGSNGTAPYTFTYTINGGANQTVTTTSGNSASVAVPTGTAGAYTYALVSVQDASATACANAASGNATVTVTATPAASFSYPGNPYCPMGTATPAFSGTGGGTFSSTTGLNINSTTGVIDLAASTPGTYTVTYTVAAAGGCSSYTTATTVTILPPVAISTQPAAQTVCAGTGVTLQVAASGSHLTYQWQKDGADIAGAFSATYHIASASVADAGAYSVTVVGDCGAVVSELATITVNTLPAITTQPTAQAVCLGSSASFTVGATGTGLTYQWRKDGANIPGATSATYARAAVAAGDVGNYDVVITGTCGTVTSTAVALTLKAATTIATQPVAQTVCAGGTVSFTVAASGEGAVSYQWKKDGSSIASATGATYSIAAATAAHAGTYTVDVTAACGTISSNSAVLTVNPLPAASISGTTAVCQNATAPSITFSGSNGTAPYAFTYTINGGSNQTVTTTSGNSISVQVPTSTAGIYTYELVSVQDASATACANSASGTATVTVTALPTANFSYAASPYCNSGSALPTFSGTTGGTYTSTAGLSLNSATGAINLAASTPGTYTVTYTIAAAAGCSMYTTTASVTINAATDIITPPTAQTVCAGNGVTLSVTAAGSNLTYQWRKEGAPIANATNNTYVIATTSATDVGAYDVVVTGDCGTLISSNVNVAVNAAPAISTQPVAQVVCAGAPASFSVTATGTGLTYQWQKDGADIAGANSTTYTINNTTAANAGNYSVVITGTCGTITSAAASLTVNALTIINTQPVALVTCAGSGVTFSVTATGSSLSYQWYKGATAITGATSATYTMAAVSAADAGNYHVAVSGNCGSLTSASAALTVNTVTVINTQPVAQTVCAGGTATFSVIAAGTNLGYQWYRAGNPLAGATSATLSLPGVSATDAGDYYVVISGDCGTVTSATAALTVLPTTAITTHPVNQVVCVGTSVTFTGSAVGSGVSYKWQKDGVDITGATSSTYTLTATAAAAGSYRLVATSACGVATSNAATLTVNAIPATPTITAGGATTFCQGESVTLTSSAASGNQWYKDGVAIAGATSQTYTASVSGNYTVQTTQSSCISAVSAATSITVNPLPATPTISATGNILTSSAASSNQWFLNGVAINGATGQTHRVQASGLYTVQVFDGNCVALSSAYNFVATAIGNPGNWNGTVTTYPNPVFQTLFVKNTTGHKLQLQLFDGLGRKVYEGQLSGTEGRIPVTGLTNGTYRLLITDQATNKTISQSIIKL